MNRRPQFSNRMSGIEFDNWFWHKDELDEICKTLGIASNARKNELRRRIIEFLETGKVTIDIPKPYSSFDWKKEPLRLETVITDSVVFGKNLRSFMKDQVGVKFSFSAAFMEWVRNNEGKTLEDAVEYWQELNIKTKSGFRFDMSDYNVMNKYLDDFLKDNPKLKREDGMNCWQAKKFLPAPKGLVKYEPEDLRLSK